MISKEQEMLKDKMKVIFPSNELIVYLLASVGLKSNTVINIDREVVMKRLIT